MQQQTRHLPAQQAKEHRLTDRSILSHSIQSVVVAQLRSGKTPTHQGLLLPLSLEALW